MALAKQLAVLAELRSRFESATPKWKINGQTWEEWQKANHLDPQQVYRWLKWLAGKQPKELTEAQQDKKTEAEQQRDDRQRKKLAAKAAKEREEIKGIEAIKELEKIQQAIKEGRPITGVVMPKQEPGSSGVGTTQVSGKPGVATTQAPDKPGAATTQEPSNIVSMKRMRVSKGTVIEFAGNTIRFPLEPVPSAITPKNKDGKRFLNCEVELIEEREAS